jgi:hypothetical protein
MERGAWRARPQAQTRGVPGPLICGSQGPPTCGPERRRMHAQWLTMLFTKHCPLCRSAVRPGAAGVVRRLGRLYCCQAHADTHQTTSKFPFRWWGVNSTLSGRHQLDGQPRPHSAEEEAHKASESNDENPRGWADSTRSASFPAGGKVIMTRFARTSSSWTPPSTTSSAGMPPAMGATGCCPLQARANHANALYARGAPMRLVTLAKRVKTPP